MTDREMCEKARQEFGFFCFGDNGGPPYAGLCTMFEEDMPATVLGLASSEEVARQQVFLGLPLAHPSWKAFVKVTWE